MREAELVRDCVGAMNEAVDIPVTVKHRLGIDDDNSYDIVRDFVGTVAEGGSQVFIAHARNAWLKGLSPKENREVPPLKYEWVYQLKRDFPDSHNRDQRRNHYPRGVPSTSSACGWGDAGARALSEPVASQRGRPTIV